MRLPSAKVLSPVFLRTSIPYMPLPDPSFPLNSSVKTLLNGLFDYAGLFPPASLPFPDALAEYQAHREEADDWMLGPFVMTSGHWEQLLDLSDQLSVEAPIPIQLLPPTASDVATGARTLQKALDEATNNLEKLEGRAEVVGFEWKLPGDALLEASTAVASITRAESIFEASPFSKQPRYLEIVRDEAFLRQLPLYFLALGAQQRPDRVRAKVRCGGMKAADYPSTAELAAFLHAALRTGHPFKATAGLHHPVRHFNEEQQVTMHGFLNVFFATTIGRCEGLDAAGIESILSDSDPSSFSFTDSGIEWKGLKASTTEFIRDRRQLALSIGSCSFDEPRQDLRQLGWLTH